MSAVETTVIPASAHSSEAGLLSGAVKTESGQDNEFIFFHTMFEDIGRIRAEEDEQLIFYKLDYCLPFTDPKNFRGIRDLQLKVHRENVFSRKCRILIDVSDWLGHEQEDLFMTTLKYLHDHLDTWRYVFTARSKDKEGIRHMYLIMRCTMKGVLRADPRCADRHCLGRYLEDNWQFDAEAAALTASILWSSGSMHVLSDTLIRSIISDLRAAKRNHETLLNESKKNDHKTRMDDSERNAHKTRMDSSERDAHKTRMDESERDDHKTHMSESERDDRRIHKDDIRRCIENPYSMLSMLAGRDDFR